MGKIIYFLGRITTLVFAIRGLCFLSMFIINGHFRFITFETLSHYFSKIAGTDVIICGDSIGAGIRHLSGIEGLPPFRSRNLAGNAYTLGQILSQVEKAKALKPRLIIVAGGTNDAFAIMDGRATLNQVRADVLKIIKECGETRCLFVLPPPSAFPEMIHTLDDVRNTIRTAAEESDVLYLDICKLLASNKGYLLPKYSNDGIHLTPEAYRILGLELRQYLEN